MLNEIEKEIKEIKNNNKKFNTISLSGGGIKGIVFLGALKYLDENNLLKDINTFCGVSVGSIICFLLIIGYKYNDLYKFILNLDIKKFINIDINLLLEKYGLNDGKDIINILKIFMKKKNIKENITFKELYELTNKELIISVSNINDKKVEYFNYKNYPDFEVLLSIRMSFSIPLIFSPVIYNDKYYIDGSCLDDLICNKENNNNCLCLYINNDNEINNITSYFSNIINTLIYKKNINECKNLIIFNISNIDTFNFNVSKEKIEELFKLGYDKTYDYFIYNKN